MAGSRSADRVQYRLTADGLLQVRAAAACAASLGLWLPLSAASVPVGPAAALVCVSPPGRLFASAAPAPEERPTARLDATKAYLRDERVTVTGPGVRALVDLAASRADAEFAADAGVTEVTSCMNFAAALLLARAGRFLMHCAAVAAPDGAAWVLAGDSHAGKTTTSLNLARAGWQLLSDDHIVLRATVHGHEIEGWPRRMNVDSGWESGRPEGVRVPVDPASIGGIGRIASAPFGGTLLPAVVADAVTSILPAGRAAALAMLIRQSAWSLIDPVAAPAAMATLAAASGKPRFTLRLARDTFGDPQRLASIVGPATGNERPE